VPPKVFRNRLSGGLKIALVQGYEGGEMSPGELVQKPLFEAAPLAILRHEHGQVRPVQDGACAGDAGFTEGALVVDARRVDEQDGSERQKFHGLFHGVRRGPRLRGNDGHGLPGDGVEEAALAHVPPAENPDVEPHVLRSSLHRVLP